jgi:hypothetical protein
VPRYGSIDFDYASRLATADPATDGPVYMLNLMKYRARADYGEQDEQEDRGGPVSGRDADDRYLPVDVLAAIGAAPCFLADVLDASEDWDRVGVVLYPTRRSFIEMQSRKDFKDKHVHKEAGMDHTIVMGTLPESPGVAPTSARASGGKVLLEVWRGKQPPPPAGATSAGFAVEGTIVGDGRAWDGARYTTFTGDLKIPAGGTDYQVLVLAPSFERWT